MKKVMFVMVSFFVILFIGFSFADKSPINKFSKCNDDLQRLVNQIKRKSKSMNAVLLQEQYFDAENNSGERKTLWKGGFSYCDGNCFAVVTVTGHCFLGYCWGFQATSSGDEECPCGTFCPCTVTTN